MTGIAVIGLLIGLLGGWALFGSDADVIAVDGGDLTDRQIEMTEVVADSFDAWTSNDVDQALSYYADTGVFVALGVEYPAADGSLAGYIERFITASRMEPIGPEVVVDGNTVVSFHTYSGSTYTNVFEFTSSGDVLIARHTVSG
jgi:hypothetical protein